MKKILSVVLAVVLAFSLCTSVMAAPDLSAIKEKLAELGINFSVDEVMSILETITADISEEQLQGAIEDALATIGEFVITSLTPSRSPPSLIPLLSNSRQWVWMWSPSKLNSATTNCQLLCIYLHGRHSDSGRDTEEETTEEEIPHTGSSVGGMRFSRLFLLQQLRRSLAQRKRTNSEPILQKGRTLGCALFPCT
jgi:hypothetical protein